MGEREVRVRCFVECVDLVEELTRLHRGCVRDPMSTPHHVATEAATISLGCCTEARSAYEELCGAEGPAGPCVSEWGARCDAGLLGEATP